MKEQTSAYLEKSRDLLGRAAMSMDATPLVRLLLGVVVAIGLYLTNVGWLAKGFPLTPPKSGQAGTGGMMADNDNTLLPLRSPMPPSRARVCGRVAVSAPCRLACVVAAFR